MLEVTIVYEREGGEALWGNLMLVLCYVYVSFQSNCWLQCSYGVTDAVADSESMGAADIPCIYNSKTLLLYLPSVSFCPPWNLVKRCCSLFQSSAHPHFKDGRLRDGRQVLALSLLHGWLGRKRPMLTSTLSCIWFCFIAACQAWCWNKRNQSVAALKYSRFWKWCNCW